MIQELLVIASCVTSKGCQSSTYTYTYYNPDAKQQIESVETAIKNRLPKKFVTAFLPVVAVVANKRIEIPVNNNIKLKHTLDNTSSAELVYAFDF